MTVSVVLLLGKFCIFSVLMVQFFPFLIHYFIFFFIFLWLCLHTNTHSSSSRLSQVDVVIVMLSIVFTDGKILQHFLVKIDMLLITWKCALLPSLLALFLFFNKYFAWGFFMKLWCNLSFLFSCDIACSSFYKILFVLDDLSFNITLNSFTTIELLVTSVTILWCLFTCDYLLLLYVALYLEYST